jgi:hypothetical protein
MVDAPNAALGVETGDPAVTEPLVTPQRGTSRPITNQTPPRAARNALALADN